MHPHHHGPGRHIFSYLIRFAANPRGLDKGRSVQGVDEERHPYPPAAARRSETTVKYIVIVQSSFSFTSTAHFSPYRAGLLLLLLHSWFSAGWSTQASSPFPSVPPLASWWASTCIGMLPGKHRCSTWFRAVAPAATSTTAAVASRTMASLRPSTARKTAPSRPHPRACNIHVRGVTLRCSAFRCFALLCVAFLDYELYRPLFQTNTSCSESQSMGMECGRPRLVVYERMCTATAVPFLWCKIKY